MTFDESIIEEITDILKMLIEEEDLSSKIKIAITKVYSKITPELDEEDLLKIQDELENISTMNNLNDFCRTELMNLITSIEAAVNS